MPGHAGPGHAAPPKIERRADSRLLVAWRLPSSTPQWTENAWVTVRSRWSWSRARLRSFLMHARMTLGNRSMGWMASGTQNGPSLAHSHAQPNVPDRLREADPSLRRSQKWRALAQCSSGVQSAGLGIAPRRHGADRYPPGRVGCHLAATPAKKKPERLRAPASCSFDSGGGVRAADSGSARSC